MISKYYSDQNTSAWNSDDDRFSSPVYLRTKVGEDNIPLSIEDIVTRLCIKGNHSHGKGFILNRNHRLRCKCHCHDTAEGLRSERRGV